MKIVAFMVAEQIYSVPVESVAEVTRSLDIKKIPKTPEFIEGVIYWRQKPIPVINIRARFGEKKKEPGILDRIIVINSNDRYTGLLVDSVMDVMKLDSSLISLPDPVLKSAQYLQGIYTYEGKMVLIADPSKILSAAENLTLEALV